MRLYSNKALLIEQVVGWVWPSRYILSTLLQTTKLQHRNIHKAKENDSNQTQLKQKKNGARAYFVNIVNMENSKENYYFKGQRSNKFQGREKHKQYSLITTVKIFKTSLKMRPSCVEIFKSTTK